VGSPARTGASVDVAISEGVPVAIAVLSADGAVERATIAFLERFDVRDGTFDGCREEVEEIVAGESEHLAVSLDGAQAELLSAVDGDGRRVAVLTILDTDGEPAGPLLEAPLYDSPAIVWLKDLDGRYLRVNRRYLEQLGTDADSVVGRTDAELTAARSLEGLRLEEEDTAAGRELLELEYRIGAFEGRPAFAVLRFALRDREGQPTATCSVAAPVTEESVARTECERLMRIERWARFDVTAIRQESLNEWGLELADGRSGPPLDRDDRVAAALLERDEALAAAARLEDELAKERDRAEGIRTESERAGRRTDELADAIAAEQARSGELEQSLARAEARMGELESDLESARAELEEQVANRDALEAAAAAPESSGLRWSAGSQRAFSSMLAGTTEWRAVLKRAASLIGAEGGWDASIAWCPDKPRGSMACASVWIREGAGLGTFETRTWQHRADASSAEFGRVRNRMAATCLLDLQSAEDPLLRAAGAAGMGTAVLLPVGDGSETIAMVELLSRTTTAPNAELMVALDAIELQLGGVAQLLKLSDVPRWRVGRV
jgi:PAS domain S-box-containing protein